MDESVDLAAIVEQLQADNEKLRESIARIRLNPPRWWQSFNIRDFEDILTDNYFWLGVAVGVIVAIAYGIAPFFSVSRRRDER